MSFRKGLRDRGDPGSATVLLTPARSSEDWNAEALRDPISGSKRVNLLSSSQLLRTSWIALYRLAKVFLSSVRKQSTRFLCAISPHRVRRADSAADIRLLCSLILVFARLRSWYLLSLTRWASSSRVVVSLSGTKSGFVYCERSGRRVLARDLAGLSPVAGLGLSEPQGGDEDMGVEGRVDGRTSG